MLVTRGGSALAGTGRNSQLQRWIELGTNFNFNDGSSYDPPNFAVPMTAPAMPAARETPLVMLNPCRWFEPVGSVVLKSIDLT